MKHIYIILLLFVFSVSYGQYKKNSPWDNSEIQRKGTKPTLKEMADYAEAYFSSIDASKKGSGLKPFKRWEYHWSHYLNEDGTIASKEKLWEAWRQKNALHQESVNNQNDTSDWMPLGPYDNSSYQNPNKRIGQGRVNAIAVDPNNPNTYYVGTPAGGIWKSTDAGLNWTPLTDYLPQIGVSGIAINPNNSNEIYIATGDDDASDSYSVGVWKTTDGGTTWNNTGNIPGNPDSMNEIYIDPNNTNTVLVATESGVQKTTDGGINWSTKLSGNIIDLKMKPGDSSTWYAVSSNTFYKSSDGGENFTPVSLPGLIGSRRLTMDVTIADPDYVYIVSAGDGYAFNGVYKSTNSGSSFTKTSETDDIFESTQAWYDLALTVSDKNPEIVYVGVLDVWKSSNGGNNFNKINEWYNLNNPRYTHADIHFLRFINGRFFAGTDGGIYVSDDEATSFTDLSKNLAISQFYRISITDRKPGMIAGGLQDNGGFSFSGESWNHYHGGDGMEGVIDPLNSSLVYGFMQYGQTLTISTNSGVSPSFSLAAPSLESGGSDRGGNWITPLTINKEGELYSGYSQVYKLSSGVWEKVSNHFFGGDLDRLVIHPKNSNIMYASKGSNLYRSTDRGVTFIEIPISQGSITGIAPNPIDEETIWVCTTGNVVKISNLSSNPNTTTVGLNVPTESKTVIKHHERSGNNTLYLGTTLGVYYITDGSDRWQTFDNNLPNTKIRDLEISEEESKLYVATYGRGVFVSNIPQQLPENDVRLLGVSNIQNNNILCSTDVSPSVVIKNQGLQEINNLTINYNLDGGINETFEWAGRIDSGAQTNITLPTISSTSGTHSIYVQAELVNDAYSTNNETTVMFTLNNSSTDPTAVNGFEDEAEELLKESSSGTEMWRVINRRKTLLNIPSGRKAYATSEAEYPTGTTGYLYTTCYDLSQIVNPTLSFDMGFDIEKDWDYLVVEYTTNSGESWEILGSASDPNWYNSSSTLNGLPGKQWTGEGENINITDNQTNATIKQYSHDLSELASETNIIFRFRFLSDAAVVEEGVVIDNLVISGVLSTDDEVFLKGISVYPNPSESIFNINRNISDKLTVKVFDITGKQVYLKKNTTDTNFTIDLSNHSKGIYIMNMVSNGKTATKKLVLK